MSIKMYMLYPSIQSRMLSGIVGSICANLCFRILSFLSILPINCVDARCFLLSSKARETRLFSMESSLSSSTTFEGNTKILLKLTPATQKDQDIRHDQKSTEGESRKLEPVWLERFFKRTFFYPCSEHPIRRNELNKYCIDCDVSLCQYCLSPASHEDHRLLKIYRHVYKDVVPLDEIECHIDCSQIQPYRCNKQLVIALTPLPHSGGNTSDEVTCETCKRKLIEYHIYNYCSISCKVEAFTKKDDDNSPPFLSLNLMMQKAKQGSEPKKTSVDHRAQKAKHESELNETTVDQPIQKNPPDPPAQKDNQEPELKKRSHKRKGMPHRAPFF